MQFRNGSSDRNIITYAAHDTTISNVLTSMYIVDQTEPLPSYAALLAFEMYADKNHDIENIENTVQVS